MKYSVRYLLFDANNYNLQSSDMRHIW